MSELPSGTVTFLFTDIEGSTQLLEQLGADRYGQVLADQRRIVRAAYEQFGGTEIDTQGDAFFISFLRATEGVAAAAKVQRDLAKHDWPAGVAVRVRMGLHTGEPWLIEEGYVGMDVHRAARIGHIAHGGQVLLSETTTPLVRNELPAGVRLLDLGRHRLKDVRQPEPIHQLVIEGLPDEFPPLTSLESLPPYRLTAAEEQIVREPREVGASPYRGLAAFQEADAPYFFGREVFTEELYDTVTHKPMTAVIVGSSGAGKSSAVAAGLLPRLRSEGDWLVLRFRPGAQPFHALAMVLLPRLEPELDETERLISAAKLAEAFLNREVSLIHVVDRLLEKSDPGTRVLLIADQFEELYTLCPDLEVRQSFLDELLDGVHRAAGQAPARLVLLLTLRADFMGQALTHRPFADELKEGALLLGPMNRAELQAAIEKPAEKQGAAFETGLVARILDDVGAEPGNLPLLEFALTLLWDQMDQGWLTHVAYDVIGRVEGALSRHADEVYSNLQEGEQEQARRIFVQVVQPGEGTEDTRRVARRSDLVGVEWALVQRLADERLVVTGLDESGDETVEVVHEALIRGWGQLGVWMAADREFRRWQEGLRAARRAWAESGQDNGALLRGAPLVNAEDWLESRADELSPAEVEYIESSRTNHELIQARREQRRRLIIGGLAVGLVVALLLTIFAFGQRGEAQNNLVIADANAATADAERVRAEQEADGRATQQAVAEGEQARAESEKARAEQEVDARATAQAEAVAQAEIARFNEAQARSLALISSAREVLIGGDVDLALALAVQAVDIEQPPPEAVRTLGDVVFAHGSRYIHEIGSSEWAGMPPMIPDGSPLLTPDRDSTVAVWANYSGELLSQLSIANGDANIRVPAIIPDSTRLTVGYENGEVIVWDWSTGEKVQTLLGVDSNIYKNFPGPDGESVVAISYHGQSETEVDGLPDGFRMVAWDIDTGEQNYRYDGARGERMVWAVSTPDNRIALISASLFDEQANNTGVSRLLMVALETGEILAEPAIAELNGNNYVEFLAINSAGDQAFAIITDVDDEDAATGVFISLPAGEVVATVPFDTNVEKGIYSPDGSQFVVDRHDETSHFTLLDTRTGEEIRRLGGPTEGHISDSSFPNVVAFTPDGKRLVSGGGTGDVLLWDVETGELIQRLLGHSGAYLISVNVSPDGQTAITLGGDIRLHFWDITQGAAAHVAQDTAAQDTEDTAAQVFDEHKVREIYYVAISPDGTQAVSTGFGSTGGPENEAILWDTSTLEVIHRLPGIFITAHFLPDGRSVVLGGIVDFNDGQSQLVHWDIESGEVFSRRKIPDSTYLYDLDVSSDGTSILFVDETNILYDYDIETLSEIKTNALPNEEEWLYSVIYSPDGHSALAGGDAGDVVLLNLESGEVTQRYNHGGTAEGLVFSTDGERFVSAGGNNTVVLWDVASGEAIQTFNGHSGQVTSVVFTQDEAQLISGSGDGTLILWDVATGEALRTYSEHSDWVNEVALALDGQLVYSAAYDGTVIVRPVIELSVDEMLAYIAENRVLREFTCPEREQYHILPLCDADGLVPNSGN